MMSIHEITIVMLLVFGSFLAIAPLVMGFIMWSFNMPAFRIMILGLVMIGISQYLAVKYEEQ